MTGINNVPEQEWRWHKEGNLLVLSGVPAGTKVQLYDLRGIMLNTIVSSGEEITLPLLNTHALHVLKVGNKVIKL